MSLTIASFGIAALGLVLLVISFFSFAGSDLRGLSTPLTSNGQSSQPQPASSSDQPMPSVSNDSPSCNNMGTFWQYDDNARTMTWTGATDGSEDIWQGDDESLQKIRNGYTATFATTVSGAFINTCILTVNGQVIKNSCASYSKLYPVPAGTYQVTSKSPPGYPTNGGFRWSTQK